MAMVHGAKRWRCGRGLTETVFLGVWIFYVQTNVMRTGLNIKWGLLHVLMGSNEVY